MASILPPTEGVTTPPEPECECFPTPEHMHYVYYGAREPGSMWEWNPDCPAHPPYVPVCDCSQRGGRKGVGKDPAHCAVHGGDA